MVEQINISDIISILGYRKLPNQIIIPEALATPKRDALILYSVAKAISAKTILEIGTFYGHTTLGLALNCPNATIFTIDIFKELKISVPSYQEIEVLPKEQVGNIFKNKVSNVNQIFGDSRIISTYNNLPPVDFAYIDGNHKKSAIIADTENVLKIMKHNGVIFWHDYKNDGLVETVEAIKEISIKFKINVYHIRNTWLAFSKIIKT